MKPANYSEPRKCEHCGHFASMLILSKAWDRLPYNPEEYEWDGDYLYTLLKCHACKNVMLFQEYVYRYVDPEPPPFCPDLYDPDILYPTSMRRPKGLPDKVLKAYRSAQRVRYVDPNSYAVQLRRMLEFICKDQNASGNSLAAKLQHLSARNLIPDQLGYVVKHLKNFGNIGAHAADFDITEAEIPLLDSLAQAIVEYIYTAPALVQEAEERFRQLSVKTDE